MLKEFPERIGFEEAFVGEGEAEDDVSDDVVDDDDDELDDDELEVEEFEGEVVDDVVELVDDGGGGLVVVCMAGVKVGCPITAMIGTPIFFILFEGFPEGFGFEQASVGEGEGENDVSDDVVDDDDDELDEELEVEELEGDVVDDVVKDGELIDDGEGGLAMVCMTGVKVGLNA